MNTTLTFTISGPMTDNERDILVNQIRDLAQERGYAVTDVINDSQVASDALSSIVQSARERVGLDGIRGEAVDYQSARSDNRRRLVDSGPIAMRSVREN